MQKKQKGQSIVEFALVLPLLMLFVFGLVYFGMVLADYLALSNLARISAREAAVITDDSDYRNNYQAIRAKHNGVKLPMNIFNWQAESTDHYNIYYDENSQNVKVVMKADLNTAGSHLGGIVNKMAGGTNLARIDITYSMYSEYTPK